MSRNFFENLVYLNDFIRYNLLKEVDNYEKIMCDNFNC